MNLSKLVFGPLSPIEFHRIDDQGRYLFLNDWVIHPTPQELVSIIEQEDIKPEFAHDPPITKNATCCVKGCLTPPCKSHLSNYHCPKHFALIASSLRLPDSLPREKYMGRVNLGSNVVIRCTPETKHAEHIFFENPFIIKFNGKMCISINGNEPVNKWRFYVEEINSERYPVFEIFDSIHFHQGILKGDYDGRIEGQPICEQLLKGHMCGCTAGDYPYQDSIPELVARSSVPGSYALPGVFPMDKNGRDGRHLCVGRLGVRCAQVMRTKKDTDTEVKEVKEVKVIKVPHNEEDMKDRLIESQSRQINILKQLVEQLSSESKTQQKLIAKLRADNSDLEKQNADLLKKITN